MDWPLFAIMLGAKVPTNMPAIDAIRPSKLAGTRVSGAKKLNTSQVPTPNTTENKAPWVLARFQNAPATSGTKAPVKVTL